MGVAAQEEDDERRAKATALRPFLTREPWTGGPMSRGRPDFTRFRGVNHLEIESTIQLKAKKTRFSLR